MAHLAYDHTGDRSNPAIIMGHALGADRHVWDRVLPVLSRRFFVVRYDLPGHGQSPARHAESSLEAIGGYVVELQNELGLSRAHHVGISLGGMVALWIAENHPELVDRLIMVSSAAVLPPPEKWTEKAAAVRQEGTAAQVEGTLERWFTPGFDDEARERTGQSIAACDDEAYARACEAISEADLRADLKKVEAPTLLLPGEDDPGTDAEADEALLAGIRSGGGLAERVVVPGVAHASSVERPGVITARIAEFLDDDDPMLVRGLGTRREVMGDRAVADIQETTNALTADFQDVLTRYSWGEVWSREGLDLRTRTVVAITALIASGRFESLPAYLRAALQAGVRVTELREVLLQCGVYVGMPAAQHAFDVAAEVLRGEGYDL